MTHRSPKKRQHPVSSRPVRIASAAVRPGNVATLGLALLLLCTGCASWTNPVANGIPARLVPDELLAQPKDDLETIPLAWLRRKPEEPYRLATGDILGVFIEGVLGEPDQLPPINFPDVADAQPSVGFPIPVREDGTVPLPLVPPIKVDGMTISEAQEAIVNAYTEEKEILKPEEARILVTLAAPRREKILVVREDSAIRRASSFNTNLFLGRGPHSPATRTRNG